MQELSTKPEIKILNEFGLGIEHFVKKGDEKLGLSKEENSKIILQEAFNLGIRHFDIVYNYPHFYSVFKDFLLDKQDKISFTTHIGQFFDEKTGSSKKTRSLDKIQESIDYIFNFLDIDTIQVGMIQYITNYDDFERVKNKNILNYVFQLKKQGKLQSIGISAHNQKLLLKIIDQIDVDIIMFPVNFVTGHLDDTKDLIHECKDKKIKIMGIKTLLHGKPFTTKRIKYPKLMSCGYNSEVKLEKPAYPYQCFNYALNCGVDKIIFGVSNVVELRSNISNYMVNKEIIDYDAIENQFISGQKVD